MLEHKTVVGSKVRFALDTIYNKVLAFLALWNRQLNMSRESCTASTNNTAFGNLGADFFGAHCDFGLQVGSAVDGFEPFVAFDIDEDTGILVARSVDCLLNLSNSTRYRRVNVCRYESGALSDELSDLYGVALGNYRFGRSTDVLCDRNHYLLGQFYSFDRISF